MTSINALTKSTISIAVTDDIKFSALRILLDDVAPLYPNFDAWLHFTFRRNLRSGERKFVVAHDGTNLLGAALLKQNKIENKICTFFVSPAYRSMKLGNQLIDTALATLDSEDTFITVSSERKEELTPLLKSKGFSISNSIDDLYRSGSTEYFFTL